jgi:hypothetical protein
MAKKRAGKSRSQHIREYLADHPTATPNQIVDALNAKGITASVGLASNVKYTSGPGGKSRRKKVIRRKPGRKPSGTQLTVQQLVEVKRLAQELGGIEQARKALDALATLQQ